MLCFLFCSSSHSLTSYKAFNIHLFTIGFLNLASNHPGHRDLISAAEIFSEHLEATCIPSWQGLNCCWPQCHGPAYPKQSKTQRQSPWNQPEALKQYVSYWEVLEVRMYTPVLFAAQMELGWIRGITTCPSINPYLQEKHQRLPTCTVTHLQGCDGYFIISHRMPCHALQCFIQLTPRGGRGFNN